jgi:hypothetical protein
MAVSDAVEQRLDLGKGHVFDLDHDRASGVWIYKRQASQLMCQGENKQNAAKHGIFSQGCAFWRVSPRKFLTHVRSISQR